MTFSLEKFFQNFRKKSRLADCKIWLENFLYKYSSTVLIISHDRDLLNNSVNGILHLSGCKLNYYKGNYDQFESERRVKLEQQMSMKKKQDAQRQHIQSFVDKFRYKASKARQAQSRLKQLEKMQPILALSENVVSAFNFPSPKEISPPIIKIESGSVGYNENVVLNNINIRFKVKLKIIINTNSEHISRHRKIAVEIKLQTRSR